MLRPTMVTEIRERLGETVADFWPDTFIHRGLDEAMKRFANEERWHWLYSHETAISIAAEQTTLVLKDNVSPERHFDLMYVPTSEPLRPIIPKRVDPPEGLRLRQRLSSAGDPLFYYIVSAVIPPAGGTAGKTQYTVRFIPQPSRPLTAEYQYIRVPAAMDDTNEPDVPTQYVEAIIAWTTGNLWLKELNGGSKAQEQFNLYANALEQARQDMKQLPRDEQLAWGGGEPQVTVTDEQTWVMGHIPPTLG